MSLKTLIVEDDLVCRALLVELLKPYCQCDVAVDGEEARAAFMLAQNESAPYEVIFLDILMPGMNGFEILQYIRSFEKRYRTKQQCKIIMTSSLDDQNNVFNAYRKQCDSYLIKPVSLEKIAAACDEAGVCVI